jgi:hypothetical protein
MVLNKITRGLGGLQTQSAEPKMPQAKKFEGFKTLMTKEDFEGFKELISSRPEKLQIEINDGAIAESIIPVKKEASKEIRDGIEKLKGKLSIRA